MQLNTPNTPKKVISLEDDQVFLPKREELPDVDDILVQTDDPLIIKNIRKEFTALQEMNTDAVVSAGTAIVHGAGEAGHVVIPTVEEVLPEKPLTENQIKFLEVLEKNFGVVSTACKAFPMSRTTHYEWYNTSPLYRKAVDDLSDYALDFAESQLLRQIGRGEVSATIFYLKTKGKKRGYIEKVEHDLNPDGKPIGVTFLPQRNG